MWALLEFFENQKRECAVVPLIWLVNDRKSCYWPRMKTPQAFIKLAKEKFPYQRTWLMYPVYRVLNVHGKYKIYNLLKVTYVSSYFYSLR